MPKTRRTRTGYTTDADALEGLYAKTEHPFLAAPAAAPRPDPAAADRRGAAEVDRRRRPHPHHLPADRRRHRPAQLDRPEPAEHPDPHRGRTPHPRGVRRRRGLRVADDGRLQPDRDADHGARVRGRGADRGVRLGRGLSHRDRFARVRCRAGPGHRGDARQDQGDELRPGLRPERVRAVGAAEDLDVRGEGPDGGVLRAVRARARLPGRDRRRRPQDRLHRDDPRTPPLPARPDLVQPAAPRDGRADGAERPDPGVGSRHHQGRDARRRGRPWPRRGWRRGCCCRCTTNSCSRWRPASARRWRRSSASGWATRSTWRCRST